MGIVRIVRWCKNGNPSAQFAEGFIILIGDMNMQEVVEKKMIPATLSAYSIMKSWCLGQFESISSKSAQ